MDAKSFDHFIAKHCLEGDIENTLKQHGFDCREAVLLLNEDDMEKMTLPMGKRKKLLSAIYQERNVSGTPNNVQPIANVSMPITNVVTGKIMTDESVGPSKRTGTQMDIEDVRERIRQLKERRIAKTENTPSSSGVKSTKKKPELRVNVGKKILNEDGCYTLFHKSKGGGIRKLTFDRHADYNSVLRFLCDLFGEDHEHAWLINHNDEVLDRKTFSIEKYCKSYDYIGITLLYLAVDSRESSSSLVSPDSEDDNDNPPPELTPQKAHVLDLSRGSHADMKDITALPQKKARICNPELEESQKKNDDTERSVQDVAEKTVVDPIIPKDKLSEKAATDKQIKNDDNYPSLPIVNSNEISYSDVLKYVKKEGIEYSADRFDESLQGELAGVQLNGRTPMHMGTPVVVLFNDLQKSLGIEYEMKCTGWGEFLLIPKEDLDKFFRLRSETSSQKLATLCPPLYYFLGTTPLNVDVKLLSCRTVCLSDELWEAYQSWYEGLKSELE